MQMKRMCEIGLISVLLLTVLCFIACGDGLPTPEITEDGTGEITEYCETTVCETTAEETQITEESKMEVDVFGNGYNTNMLVGFDEQGHTVSPILSEREGKQVGIFYFLWLGQPYAADIYDVSKIIEKYGKDEVFKNGQSTVSPNGQAHWWGKPLYGYYNSADEWIIRRHLELLTNAGVDFLVFDTTNAVTYDNVAKRVMRVICELRAEGWDAPQAVYYTHSYSIQTMWNLYHNIYSDESLSDAWYRVEGKPMIIGYTKPKTDTRVSENPNYDPGPLEDEIADFFYIREARWPNDPVGKNTWPYTEWRYPQPLNGNMISVSIATHPMVPFSFSLTHENWCNWGRGFDVETKTNVHGDIMKGTFFDAQWETVYKRDPDFVFVTGWNEWIAYKQPYGGEYMLCDNVDMEYSRDAEPMEGGYEDAYYIQMIDRIRRYKGVSTDGTVAKTVKKTINLSEGVAQWEDVNAIYRRIGKDNAARNSYGGAQTVIYETDAVENNILEVRVTCDKDNIYLLIKTDGDIKEADRASFMNVFIGCGTPELGKGWESYEFAVNRSRSGNVADVERLNADFTGEKLGTAEFSISGNAMQVSIPRALLGLENGGDFYFKVADGVSNPAEIMDYYASGRSLPLGRLSYLYQII